MVLSRNSVSPRVRDLLALIKAGIVVSNTLTALGGMALSPWSPGLTRAELCLKALCLGFGTALLVAGSCTINNWLDRDIDSLMSRTKDRPTAAGRLKAGATLTIGGLLLGLGIGLLALDGELPALLGALGALVYILPYTLLIKRRSGTSSLVGGVAGALPPLMGWAVMDPSLGGPALLLFAFLVAWQQAHVRALSLRRRIDFDRAALPMPGIVAGAHSGSGTSIEGSQSVLAPGKATRRALLVWILALIPFPLLVARALPVETHLAFALPQTSLILLWWGWGLMTARPSHPMQAQGWGSLMFFMSLFELVFFFAGLLVAKLAGLSF